MITIADLEKIRQKTLSSVSLRREHEGIRVIVSMGTSGIAAGAHDIVKAFLAELGKRSIMDVVVAQADSVGMCQQEPVVQIACPGKEKVTYANVTADKVARIVEEHVVNGNPVAEYIGE